MYHFLMEKNGKKCLYDPEGPEVSSFAISEGPPLGTNIFPDYTENMNYYFNSSIT